MYVCMYVCIIVCINEGMSLCMYVCMYVNFLTIGEVFFHFCLPIFSFFLPTFLSPLFSLEVFEHRVEVRIPAYFILDGSEIDGMTHHVQVVWELGH